MLKELFPDNLGAGSIVTKDVPDFAVAVGSPAKVIKYLDRTCLKIMGKNK